MGGICRQTTHAGIFTRGDRLCRQTFVLTHREQLPHTNVPQLSVQMPTSLWYREPLEHAQCAKHDTAQA